MVKVKKNVVKRSINKLNNNFFLFKQIFKQVHEKHQDMQIRCHGHLS